MRNGLRSVLGTVSVTAAVVLPAGVSPHGTAPAAAAEPGDACQVGDTGRFTDCESGFYSWNIRQSNGELLGTADIAFTLSETVSPTSRQWSAHWTVFVVNLAGVAQSGTTMAVVPECGGTCSAGSGLPDNGAVLSRNQTVAGDVAFSAPGTGRDTSTQTINIYLFNPASLGPGTTYGDPRTTLGPVRCDDGVPGEDDGAPPVPGCVVADEVPTFRDQLAGVHDPPGAGARSVRRQRADRPAHDGLRAARVGSPTGARDPPDQRGEEGEAGPGVRIGLLEVCVPIRHPGSEAGLL